MLDSSRYRPKQKRCIYRTNAESTIIWL